jgi:hypothetical protein
MGFEYQQSIQNCNLSYILTLNKKFWKELNCLLSLLCFNLHGIDWSCMLSIQISGLFWCIIFTDIESLLNLPDAASEFCCITMFCNC